MSDMRPDERLPFEEAFFLDELNRFVGSGGEVLVKPDDYDGDDPTRMEVGDRLVGIGITHFIENLSHPPGPMTFRPVHLESDYQMKVAARAFVVSAKRETDPGFEFEFEALTPREFSRLLIQISDGRVELDPDTIPEGSMVLSLLHDEAGYTLEALGDPAGNWSAATAGRRHWNVGVASDDDFWWARFPSDDLGLLADLPPYARVGEIRFGLSMLPDSREPVPLEPTPTEHPSGRTTTHDFCLSGFATGVAGFDTPFPIGLRTAIRFSPVSRPSQGAASR